MCPSVQHLKQQQQGLQHLIGIIKDDLEDLRLIEQEMSSSTDPTIRTPGAPDRTASLTGY